jgi:hypothetical protein
MAGWSFGLHEDQSSVMRMEKEKIEGKCSRKFVGKTAFPIDFLRVFPKFSLKFRFSF